MCIRDRNFAHTLADVISETPLEMVVTTRVGDLLGFPKSLLINTVIKYVKKLVPAFSLPGSITFSEAVASGRQQQSLNAVSLGHQDIAFLQYTGGTTGVAKGAMLTHGNMVANMLQAKAWLAPANIQEGKESSSRPCLYTIFSPSQRTVWFTRVSVLKTF